MTRRSGRIALAAGCLLVLLAAAAAFLVVPPSLPAPDFRDVRGAWRPSEAYLLDRNGEVLHELRVDLAGRRLAWVALSDVSPALLQAVLRSEDRRFYRHPGVDGFALAAAVRDVLVGNGRRGASTITMQLAARFDTSARRGGARRSWREKLRQARAALALERSWSKDEILEAYLNLVSFRGELRGVGAAARGLFGKEPSGLSEADSLLLAALIRSPNAPGADAVRRAVRLKESLGWAVTPTEADRLAGTLSVPYRIAPRFELAPHAARRLLVAGGARVVSTLDGRLQRIAAEALSRQLMALRPENVRDGAVLVAENRTGEILAYVASGGGDPSAPHVDGIAAKRQAGSTLKPFLYGLALEKRLLTAASLLDDTPLDVPTSAGMYVPRNYDREYRGLVSLRASLSSSLNVPAVRTLMLVGSDDFVRLLSALGVTDLREGDDYGFSLALGTADVSLFELVNAYRTLANGGRFSAMTLVPRAEGTPTRSALSRGASFIVSDILADRGARGLTFGLENPLATPRWTAVKTGTSKDMRDNWCVGFSDRYTVGVWVGNFSGEPMWNVSGISGAAPAWAEVMGHLLRDGPRGRPSAPPGLLARLVSFSEGGEPARSEWFLEGTEPAVAEQGPGLARPPRIRYPVQGEIVAMDPDIPEGRQLLFFEAQDARPGLAWLLNGRRAGRADRPASWCPEPGVHTLSLVDGRNRVADSVEFRVRGR